MSKQIITGIRELNFKDDEGHTVEGMTVYYISPLSDSEDGTIARGYTVGKLFVRPRTELYRRMLNVDYSKPFEAECMFDLIPGSKRPVLMDIKLPKAG